MLAASRLVGTLDILRYDVAAGLYAAGRTPHLAAVLPPGGWERRHTPGNFTLAAHAAFFAGFLPTPVRRVRLHPGAGMTAAEQHPLMEGSPYRGYVYAYRRKTAYRRLDPARQARPWAARSSNRSRVARAAPLEWSR